MVTREYIASAPRRPWGDYGSILFDGMGAHLGRVDGELQLERTGPFAPEISFPFPMILRDSARKKLESSHLCGYEFRRVRKARVVRLDWESWDSSAALKPNGGEPVNYILSNQHDASLAAAMGDFWELFSTDKTHVDVAGGDKVSTLAELERFSLALKQRLAEHLHRPSESDFYRPHEHEPLYVSERARDWFEREFPGAIQFEKIAH